MKLRNKKTGEIGEIGYIGSTDGSIDVNPINRVACETIASYNSLAELNEEWEDVPEEPKEYWCIDWTGGVKHITVLDDTDIYEKDKKQIGNYFETEEEAEKAVEKLKAWKRLKDKGFRFNKWVNVSGDGCSRPIWFYFRKDTELEDVKPDLDLLFGGEE